MATQWVRHNATSSGDCFPTLSLAVALASLWLLKLCSWNSSCVLRPKSQFLDLSSCAIYTSSSWVKHSCCINITVPTERLGLGLAGLPPDSIPLAPCACIHPPNCALLRTEGLKSSVTRMTQEQSSHDALSPRSYTRWEARKKQRPRAHGNKS